MLQLYFSLGLLILDGVKLELKLLADVGPLGESGSNIFEILSNADFPYPTITLSDGRKLKLDQAGMQRIRGSRISMVFHHADRMVRDAIDQKCRLRELEIRHPQRKRKKRAPRRLAMSGIGP